MTSFILRPYQKQMVERSLESLEKYDNTLLIASTGSGKTIVLSEIVERYIKNSAAPQKALILQHRNEIFEQNKLKFQLVSDHSLSVSDISASTKDNSGQVIFAMNQTLMQEKNLKELPKIDFLVIDECHHVVSGGSQKIISSLKAINPALKLFGVTATPSRSDRQTLHEFFTNISMDVSIHDLIEEGYLVPPKTYVIDVGATEKIKEYQEHHKKTSEMKLDAAIDQIIKQTVDFKDILFHHQDKAKDRKTVIFASSIEVSKNLTQYFNDNGLKGSHIDGMMPLKERESILKDFAAGDLSFVSNVAVLTEGWDCPIVSCIVLLRNSSYKSAYIQMIGRGLRSFPGKEDCIVLDFGVSSLTHGNLEQDAAESITKKEEREKGDIVYKLCPNCNSTVPVQAKECALCGHEFKGKILRVRDKFEMVIFDILKKHKLPFFSPNKNIHILQGISYFFLIWKTKGLQYSSLEKKQEAQLKVNAIEVRLTNLLQGLVSMRNLEAGKFGDEKKEEMLMSIFNHLELPDGRLFSEQDTQIISIERVEKEIERINNNKKTYLAILNNTFDDYRGICFSKSDAKKQVPVVSFEAQAYANEDLEKQVVLKHSLTRINARFKDLGETLYSKSFMADKASSEQKKTLTLYKIKTKEDLSKYEGSCLIGIYKKIPLLNQYLRENEYIDLLEREDLNCE